jgi:small-conductance mechanosensitive channel
VFQKTATVGGILSFFWFVYLFVHVLDARLSLWANFTDSTIDDILVPLFGKTLGVFIIILAGIIVVQNLTGIEIGPLLASLGIGGLAVAILRKIVADHKGMHPDFPPRVYFNEFNDWSLNIMFLVWYHPPGYWNFQEWVQRTCLEITQRFSAEGIDFAFPSCTLHLAGDTKRQLKIELLKKEEKAS